MQKLIGILIIVALFCAPCLGAEPVQKDSGWVAWSYFNGDQIGARLGRFEKYFELGGEVLYRDDLSPGSVNAYAVGLYGLLIVNPEAQFPIRGWVPGNLEFLPETIPVVFYLGAKCDLEFKNHNLMPAFLLGGYVKTGVHGSLGAEWQHAWNKWENVTQVSDADVFLATLRWMF